MVVFDVINGFFIAFLCVDVTNYKSFEGLAKQIGEIVQDEGLNVLLNNAGKAPKSTRINFTKDSDLRDTFETNSVAPIMLTKVSFSFLFFFLKKNVFVMHTIFFRSHRHLFHY